MELELGLSLPNSHKTPHYLQELDLINHVNCTTNQDYYYYNGDDNNLSELSCQSSSSSSVNYGDYNNINNKGFHLGKRSQNCCSNETTLPLLLWSDKQPNDDDDDEHGRLCNLASFNFFENECDDEVVGWPPINTHRKKQNDAHQRHRHVAEDGGGGGGARLNVKVKMQGCLLTRKIDLRLYNSYDTLQSTLLRMFSKDEDKKDDYKLTYQDVEGDWLLAGDVPWRTFIQVVKRLKIVRRGE
ncbi:hypothetical protein vseg_000053 [Gypsophila vaccaria]